MFIQTVGQLRKAMALLDDDCPVSIMAFGTGNTIKCVTVHKDEAYIEPIGLGDLFDAAEAEQAKDPARPSRPQP